MAKERLKEQGVKLLTNWRGKRIAALETKIDTLADKADMARANARFVGKALRKHRTDQRLHFRRPELLAEGWPDVVELVVRAHGAGNGATHPR